MGPDNEKLGFEIICQKIPIVRSLSDQSQSSPICETSPPNSTSSLNPSVLLPCPLLSTSSFQSLSQTQSPYPSPSPSPFQCQSLNIPIGSSSSSSSKSTLLNSQSMTSLNIFNLYPEGTQSNTPTENNSIDQTQMQQQSKALKLPPPLELNGIHSQFAPLNSPSTNSLLMPSNPPVQPYMVQASSALSRKTSLVHVFGSDYSSQSSLQFTSHQPSNQSSRESIKRFQTNVFFFDFDDPKLISNLKGPIIQMGGVFFIFYFLFFIFILFIFSREKN